MVFPTCRRLLSANLIAFLLIFPACKDTIEKNDRFFMLMNEGLEESNRVLNVNSDAIAKELEEKTLKPETAERAREWYPRMQKINSSITECYKYIDGIKDDVSNNEAISREKAFELHNKLQALKNILAGIDSRLNETFQEKLVFTSRHFDSLESHSGFYTTFFKNNSNTAVLTTLSKFQNNLRITQNMLNAFCNNQVGMLDGDSFYTSYSALVSQNVFCVRRGETIEIMAGLGHFSKKGSPKFKVNGDVVNMNESGYVVYKIKASGNAGKRSVPVEFSFTDGLGEKQTRQVLVEYTIEEK